MRIFWSLDNLLVHPVSKAMFASVKIKWPKYLIGFAVHIKSWCFRFNLLLMSPIHIIIVLSLFDFGPATFPNKDNSSKISSKGLVLILAIANKKKYPDVSFPGAMWDRAVATSFLARERGWPVKRACTCTWIGLRLSSCDQYNGSLAKTTHLDF